MILKDGTKLASGNKSFHYFLENVETGNKVSRFTTFERAKEERDRILKDNDLKIVGDWVLVRG